MPSSKPVYILVVDDNAQVRTLLRRCFEQEGYAVGEARDATEARALLQSANVGLITLDLNLGGDDGLSLAREIRAARKVPIIMVTGKDDPVDRVVGLELGADDYITKPFHLREVLARVRAVLRRAEPGESVSPAPPGPAAAAAAERSPRYAFGSFRLDTASRELVKDGVPVSLTTAEFNMLAMFAERPQRVLSRDSIMDLLKGHEWSPLDRSIDTLVGRLRKKIEADVENPALIKTVRGVGYVFATEVKKA